MVAAGISFFGTEHAISDTIAAEKHDAQVAQFNADTTRLQGQASDQTLARNINATQGRMAAAYGGSGVESDQGSPTDVMADSIRRGVLDRATNKYNFENTALNYEKQSSGLLLLAHNTQRTQFMTSLSAGLASFAGGNGGMGGAGTTGQTHDSFSMGGGTYNGTGSTVSGDSSMSTSWGGEGNGWNVNGNNSSSFSGNSLSGGSTTDSGWGS